MCPCQWLQCHCIQVASKGRREQVCFDGLKNSHVSAFPPFHPGCNQGNYNQDTDLSIRLYLLVLPHIWMMWASIPMYIWHTVGSTQTRFNYFFNPPPTIIININRGNCSFRLLEYNAALRIKKSWVVGILYKKNFFFVRLLATLVVKNQTNIITWLTAFTAPHLATRNGLVPRPCGLTYRLTAMPPLHKTYSTYIVLHGYL